MRDPKIQAREILANAVLCAITRHGCDRSGHRDFKRHPIGGWLNRLSLEERQLINTLTSDDILKFRIHWLLKHQEGI